MGRRESHHRLWAINCNSSDTAAPFLTAVFTPHLKYNFLWLKGFTSKGKKKKEIIKVQEVPNQVQHSHLADWETGVQRGEVTFSKLAQHLHGSSRKESFPASQAQIRSLFLGVWYSLLPHNNAHLYGCPWTAAKSTSYTSQTPTPHHPPHLSSLCFL